MSLEFKTKRNPYGLEKGAPSPHSEYLIVTITYITCLENENILKMHEAQLS